MTQAISTTGCLMRVGFLVFDELEELDLLGPWELIGVWADFDDGPSERLLVSSDGQPVRCAKGLRLTPDIAFADAGVFEVLIVPGGEGSRMAAVDPETRAFVQRQAAAGDVLSVCTGALVLAAAGLLHDRPATTHFASLDRLREQADIQVRETRFTQSARIWTSAGISAGMDMTLAYIAHAAGPDRAGAIQRWAEYYPADTVYGDPAIHADMPAYVAQHLSRAR